jgi:hypothetical protein
MTKKLPETRCVAAIYEIVEDGILKYAIFGENGRIIDITNPNNLVFEAVDIILEGLENELAL